MVSLENRDTLIEYERRIREGAFYTPLIWAAEAHKMLDEELRPNWREEYVVWDCAAGLGNLTKEYEFAELYQSTLNQEDIDLMLEAGVNPGAAKFQFDFLNDPIPGDGLIEGDVCKLPPGLRKALEEGKKFVFLINPPFGTAKTGAKMGANKEGVANTGVHGVMDLGGSKSQLYAQFMFRISKIVEEFELDGSILAVYSKPLFMSGPYFGRFRDYFYDKWRLKGGFLFIADEFIGASDQWGCSFTMWKRGKGETEEFTLILKDRSQPDLVRDVGFKKIYHAEFPANSWVRAPREMWWGLGDREVPKLSSGVIARESKHNTYIDGQIGCMISQGNNVSGNSQGVALFSYTSTIAGSLHILPENFLRCTALFTARKPIRGNWINDKDEYCAPDTSLPGYEQWVNDSVIYALFNTSSQQSSLRNIDHKGETWNIENEFFWMSNDEIKQLAIENDFQELIKDCERFDKDRYVFKILKELDLSQDAKDLLNFSKELIRLSFPLRQEAHNLKPGFHLDAWDAGWYQIRRGILQEHFPNEYEEFRQMYRKFEDRLRPGVYKFGFLKDE